MADEYRRPKDRNLVVFGVPDVPVEREISYIRDELERRPVVQDAPRPKTVAPVVPYTEPSSLLLINGLTTTPQLHMQSYVYTSDSGSNASSMAIDVDDELGYGAGTIWFLSRGSSGTGADLPGGPASYSICYVDPATYSVSLAVDSVNFTVLNGGSADRCLFFVDGKLVVSELLNLNYEMQVFDPSLPNWGCTVQPTYLQAATTAASPTTGYYTTPLTVGGTKYVMSSSGYAYDAASDSWITILGPDGVTVATSYCTNGEYMWCNDGGDLYSAPASLTPTWTLRNTDNVSLSSPSVAVMPNTGELITASNFATYPAVRRGISSYDFSTGTKTDRTGIFSATGLPDSTSQFSGTADVEPRVSNFRVTCGENLVIFTGSIRSDSLGTTVPPSYLDPTDKMWVRAVWYLTGSGLGLSSYATRIVETDVSGWPIAAADADEWYNHPYSTAVSNGSALYTWVGGTIVQQDTDPFPFVDLTEQVESWIREHQV